jgi:hypothetical protein
MEARINLPLFVPPSDCVRNMFGVGAEITIEFVAKIGFRRGRQSRQIIKDVGCGRRTLKEKISIKYREELKTTYGRSRRVRLLFFDIHKSISFIKFGTDNLARGVNPSFFPSGFLEIL